MSAHFTRLENPYFLMNQESELVVVLKVTYNRYSFASPDTGSWFLKFFVFKLLFLVPLKIAVSIFCSRWFQIDSSLRKLLWKHFLNIKQIPMSEHFYYFLNNRGERLKFEEKNLALPDHEGVSTR